MINDRRNVYVTSAMKFRGTLQALMDKKLLLEKHIEEATEERRSSDDELDQKLQELVKEKDEMMKLVKERETELSECEADIQREISENMNVSNILDI
jgi:predicted nuclease with TOPRIM domain